MSPAHIFAGRFFIGLGVGMLSTAVPTYETEVCVCVCECYLLIEWTEGFNAFFSSSLQLSAPEVRGTVVGIF